jgi:hypothetical protein
MLTAEEINYILELLRERHGPGYAKVPNVAGLQAKLSIMLESKTRSAPPTAGA